MMPVLAMAKASPRMPLPMMALLRLNTDTPNDVFPSNCGHRREMGGHQQVGRASRRDPLLPPGAAHCCTRAPHGAPSPLRCPGSHP